MKRIFSLLILIVLIFSSLDTIGQTTTKSRARKNTVIGTGAGAVTGAVVSKKHRARNAAIGGVVGAAGGYAWGKHKDKKKGRIVKKS